MRDFSKVAVRVFFKVTYVKVDVRQGGRKDKVRREAFHPMRHFFRLFCSLCFSEERLPSRVVGPVRVVGLVVPVVLVVLA